MPIRKMIERAARHNVLILAIALAIGAILRWLQIGTHSFWYDEALSSLIAGLNVPQIWSNAAASDHPPGYYLLLHFWLVFGRSETVIRSLSALFSLGAIPLIFGLGRWLFNPATGSLAALGMAVMPFQVYFAQEARMYGVVVFVATALLWIFLHVITTNGKWLQWLIYVLVAVLGLYVHYFVAFLLLALHLWAAINFRRCRAAAWKLIVSDIVIALLFLPQVGQAFVRTQAYLVGDAAWQSSPHILSPLTTIYYLLFAHRSPIWVFPVAIFLTLTILILTLWEGRRRSETEKRAELALWLGLVIPIAVVLIISWLIRPIYLERSFAVCSPALILLIVHGAVSAPRISPTPYLTALLALPIIVTLVINITTPDPAKPPVREATQILATDYAPGDVSLHLQDASFMPAAWYAPQILHMLVNMPGAAWTVKSTHQLFGGDVASWQTASAQADRLWLIVMPGFVGLEQNAVFEEIDATYPRLMTKDWESVQLYLYDLRGIEE
jgi:uncharacterized membrane protein